MALIKINLYNYRKKIFLLKKSRLIFLSVLSVITIIVCNLGLYLFYEIQEIQQTSTNQAIENEISFINGKLGIVKTYNVNLDTANKKLADIMNIKQERDKMIGILQRINQITPEQVKFTSMVIKTDSFDLKGSSFSPLYLSIFMDELNKGIFMEPLLKSDTNSGTRDDDVFSLSVKIKPVIMAKVYESH